MSERLSLHAAQMLSAYLHLGVLAALALASPRLQTGEPDAESAAERVALLRAMLDASSVRESAAIGTASIGVDSFALEDDEPGSRAGTEPRAEGEPPRRPAPPGQSRSKPATSGREGSAARSHEGTLAEAASFGMVGTLATLDPGDGDRASWRERFTDDAGLPAALWTNGFDQGFATGGMGLSEQGGGGGEGIALGGLAGMNRDDGRPQPAGASDAGMPGLAYPGRRGSFGTGTTGGFGLLGGTAGDFGAFGRMLGGRRGQRGAVCRCGDEVLVSGRLPPEVIQRIVRQNMGRFRYCYERALERDPQLRGRVVTRFLIARDGSVASSVGEAQETDLPDAGATACIVGAFSALSFPQPESGTVTVVYPLTLSPTE